MQKQVQKDSEGGGGGGHLEPKNRDNSSESSSCLKEQGESEDGENNITEQ